LLPTAGDAFVDAPCHTSSKLLVSIVITCYNQGQFLADAIRSALAQTIDDADVIVIDDGSTDDTASVAGSFPQIRYVFQLNHGLSAARNTGLAVALGSYVCFLDADDTLLPHAIESGLAAFEEHPECAFVYGDSCDVDPGGRVISAPRGPRVTKDHYAALLRGNFIGMHATVLYRRGVLRSIGGFDTRLRRCEDYDTYFRICCRFPVQEHPAIVAHYRQHDQSMSRDYATMLDAAVAVLRTQEPFIVRDPAMRDAARQGITGWRDYYGELLFEDFRYCFHSNGLTRITGRKLLALLARCPRLAGSRLLKVIAKRAERVKAGVRNRRWGRARVNLGELRRLTPFSRQFGFDLGSPVDRYYIEQFLQSEAVHIRGAVLEIGDAAYTKQFGIDRVTSSDVLHVTPDMPGATITADLASADQIPSNSFDCVILTQTLQFIFDVRAALSTVWRILRPGGHALVTVPCISQICRDQADIESDAWRFTPSSAARLFRACFGEANVEIRAYGNVLAATAFLYGLPQAALHHSELNMTDPDYPLVVCVKAVKL
jgi:glycosyltransferase involved in cell wall biosynthesis